MNPPTTLTNHNPPTTIGCCPNPNPIRREESDTPQGSAPATATTDATSSPSGNPTTATPAATKTNTTPQTHRRVTLNIRAALQNRSPETSPCVAQTNTTTAPREPESIPVNQPSSTMTLSDDLQ